MGELADEGDIPYEEDRHKSRMSLMRRDMKLRRKVESSMMKVKCNRGIFLVRRARFNCEMSLMKVVKYGMMMVLTTSSCSRKATFRTKARNKISKYQLNWTNQANMKLMVPMRMM